MKTGRTAPELPLFRKAVNLRKAINLRKTLNIHRILGIRKVLNIRKVPDIREILLPLDGRNGTYGVSKARENQANRPVLDAEEVTILPSTNIKA